MNKINCLITTKAHKEIAEKLGLNPTIVTNLASVFVSRHPEKLDATESDIKALLKERENDSLEAYLAIPIYTDMGTISSDGKLASTTLTGEIKLWRLPKENPMEHFFNYITLGNSETAKLKKTVFDRLIESGNLLSIEELKQIIQTPFEAYLFLLWHEMSHKLNDDASVYWKNGKDLMTSDKLDMEYRATLDALNKARAYRKLHPINKESAYISKNGTALYSEDKGKTPVPLYRGYALTEDREATSLEETMGHTAVDYHDSLKGAFYFTSSKEEAQDYANARTDKSEEPPTAEHPEGGRINRHYTGDYAKVSKYYIAANAKVEYYDDIEDYNRHSNTSTADVIILKRGTLGAENTEYIVKNPRVIISDASLRPQVTKSPLSDNAPKHYDGNITPETTTTNNTPNTTINIFNTPKSTDVEIMDVMKPWKNDATKTNETRRVYLKGKKDKGYFEVVKDYEDNYYSVHFKPTDKDNPKAFTQEEKTILFLAVADIIPEGANLSTWGELSKGGIAGLNRFANLGFTKTGERAVKNKKGENILIPILTKNHATLQNVNSTPRIGIDRIKVDTENPILKIAAAFTPQQRRDRVNLIARMFSDEVTGVLDELLATKEEELNIAIAQNDWILLKNIRASIEKLNDPVKGRQEAIKYVTVERIISNIQLSFQEMADYEEDEYRKQLYLNVLDNFEYLLNQATFKIERDENLKMDIVKRDKHLGNKVEEVIGGTVELVTNEDEDGREEDDDDEEGNRATGNDGWSFKIRMVDPHKTISKTTKRILSHLVKLDNVTGNPELDDLGNERYLNEQYAHTVLLNFLSDMTDDKDFCVKNVDAEGNISYTFPLLELLKGRYKWVLQVIDELTNNPKEVSAFYTDFRKDFVSYWKSKADTEVIDGKGHPVIKSIPLNLATGFASAKNQFIDNYESGTLIDDSLIYNSSRLLLTDNINKGKQLLSEIDLLEAEEEDYEKISENLAKAVRMLGLPVTASAIKSMWDTPDGNKNIATVLQALNYIYDVAGRITGKQNAHLISECETDFNTLSRLLGDVTELDAVASFRDEDKTYYSYTAPNYLTTQVKSLKSDVKRLKYLDEEFKAFDWFYDRVHHTWKGSTKDKPCWLELIENDEEVRANIQLRNLLSIEDRNGKVNYTEWTPKQIRERFITEYFSAGYNPGSKKLFGYYNYSIFSDSPVATLIKMPRYVENYKEEIIPRLRLVVRLELERIKLVEERQKKGVSKIACFDSTRGKQFCFFPFLNNWKDSDGVSFRNRVAELKALGEDVVNSFIDSVLIDYMEDSSRDFVNQNDDIAETLVEVGIADSAEDAKNKLAEYFYNHEYATTQLILLTTTDLAFYKDGTDFQKRYKEVYAAGSRLNTLSKYGREFERTIYLKDNVITSRHYTDIKSALELAKTKWVANGMDATAAQMSIDSILDKFKNVNATDAQAYRSISSMRAMLDMMGMWDENMQKSFDRILNGEWDMTDFNTVWLTIKPFVYTQLSKDSGIGDTKIKVPHLNKNSEFLLLAMHQMIATSMNKSPQLVALNEFMERNNIDVAQFESAVKVGNQGCVDITYSNSALLKWILNNPEQFLKLLKEVSEGSAINIFKEANDKLLDRGKITQEEYNKRMDDILPTKEEVLETLNNLAFNTDGTPNYNVMHIIPYKEYMIAQPTNEHFFDKEEMSLAVFGSQFRNLIVADIAEDAIFTINGRQYNKKEVLDLYNSLIIENLLEDFLKVSGRFSTIENLQKAMLNTIKGNAKYGKNILDALQLVDWTDPNTGVTKKVFNIPLYSPSIASLILEIVNAMFKNAVTKLKIKGAACILVSNFGFTDKLNIKYKKEGDKTSGIDYVECYLPWYSKQYFEPFLKEVTRNGVTYQEVDITKVPKELLDMVGYRIPTEDKYSMLPLRVVGFLPQQNGGSIMLPADITLIAGSDFDVDKLFIMMPEYRIENYDRAQAIKDFKLLNSDPAVNKLLSDMLGSDIPLEESTSLDFKEWWKENKENYKLETPIISKIRYNANKTASLNSRAARNNMLVDISSSILKHQDTTEKLLNPGSFDRIKQVERMVTILDDINLLVAYGKEKGLLVDALGSFFNLDELEISEGRVDIDSFEKAKKELAKAIREAIKKESLESLNAFLKKYKNERDPLSLNTFVYYHQQNMVGGSLIGVYANNTNMQAKYQGSGLKLRVVPPDPSRNFKGFDNTFDIDGKRIEALDLITSPWGERISKNCAEFSASSVDNVKDPVLAGLMQNLKTAKIAGFMLRAGIPIRTIGLLFRQPIIKSCIEATGDLKQGDLLERMGTPAEGHLSITTDELIDNIILLDTNSDAATRAATIMLNIITCALHLSELTQVSRADSPNGAIGISLGKARNLVQRVSKLLKRAESDTFRIVGLTRGTLRNGSISNNDDLDTMRLTLNKAKTPRLQAFYSLGIELPLLVISPFFLQLNENLDNALKGIYELSVYGILDDTMVELFYRDYIEYMLTESPLFGKDNNQTFDQKRDYYLYEFPAKFYADKQNPKYRAYNVILKIRVTDGNIEMRRSGRLTPEMRESLTSDFDSMIASEDPEVVLMAIDLFMYSFYKNGYYFGPNSFGNFFSPFFLLSFPEFMESLRSIELKVKTMNMDRFISLFYNNYWDKGGFLFEPKDNNPYNPIKKVDASEHSDILIPYRSCINPMTGVLRYPYKYLKYNNKLYYLKTLTSTTCTYFEVVTVPDYLGKKYDAAKSVCEMSQSITNKELINKNRQVGAKKVSFDDMDLMFAGIDALAASEDLLSQFEEGLSALEEAADYNIDDALAQLDEPLC